MKCIVCPVNGKTKTLDYPADFSFEWVEKQIGCEMVEIVHPRRLPRDYAMLVDEEGLLNYKPMNIVGSLLYETDKHGEPIVGDIMIVKETFNDGEFDFCGMTEEEARKLRNAIENLVREMTVNA